MQPGGTTTSFFRVGIAEDPNRRYRRTMEDTTVSITNLDGVEGQGFFAIFDGHAGKQTADWCAANLPDSKEHGHLLSVPELLDKTFTATNTELPPGPRNAGCTTIVAVVRQVPNSGERILYTANAGDARAVLCRDKKAVRLSYDHKGNDPQEIRRIIESGGFIMGNRVNVTRALGDCLMKRLIISNPYTTETVLSEHDEFLILACDGLWDIASDQEAIELIYNMKDPEEAARTLVKYALDNNTTDNLSCMVIRFT